MVRGQKQFGKERFGSVRCLHKMSLLAFFSLDAGKLQLPLLQDDAACSRGEADGVAGHSSGRCVKGLLGEQ